MAEEHDRSSQTEQPTQRRLDRARQEGDVVRSSEVAQFTAMLAAAGVVLFGGAALSRSLASSLLPFLTHPDEIDLSGNGAVAVMRAAAFAAAPVGVVMLAAAAGGAAGSFLQTGLLFTPKRLAPDLSKLNPMEGLKRLFGLDNLLVFAKSLSRLLAVAGVIWWVLKPRTATLQALVALDPAAILPVAMTLLRAMLMAALVLLAVSAGLDWVLARRRFMNQMKMSREEVKREQKESEGDPHLKAKVRQIRMQRAKSRMMQNMKKATLVIANPTHYAVALRYVQGETPAPICVAKGVDSLALRIREFAEANATPVVEDPPLARALYAAIDIDDAIPREHFQAVAKIVGFVMGEARRRARVAPALRPARL